MNRTDHKRTTELAREVLKDLKCLVGAEYRCCWVGGDPNRPWARELLIPALYIKFNHPSVVLAPALCIRFETRGFANGSLVHDAQIKDVIRRKVEKYMKHISFRPGCNTPQDMRLSEEEYA